MLLDDVLLDIFDFYLDEDVDVSFEEWIPLVHVCRRWRSLVFQSPHRLNLRLFCFPNTRARDTPDIWPPLPLIIDDTFHHYRTHEKPDNVIAVLEHNDRVGQIKLRNLTSSVFEYVTYSAAMRKPFPELTDLQLSMYGEHEPAGRILHNSFLAGTAPRLRSLKLSKIPYPGILDLLLSTTHLVDLNLRDIPPSGYIRPDLMVTRLSALTSLEVLRLHYLSPRSRPVHQTPPPLTRSILPALAIIEFNGDSEYLEEILAGVDAPRVKNLYITFFKQIIFDTPQLFQLISQRPTLRAPEMGCIKFDSQIIIVKFRSRTSSSRFEKLRVEIPCTASEWQLLSLERTCLPLVSTLKDLSIYNSERQLYSSPRWTNTLWLELLRPLAAVKNLYLSENSVRRIARALRELVGGRTTEVLPALENIFLDGFWPSGPLHKGIEKFVAARRLTSHPVAVSRLASERHWDSFDM
jgi:hypothetical protein